MPICAVCTVAVGAGLGISRLLGIDDTVTSIWIGALLLALSFWLVIWVNKFLPASKRGKILNTKYLILSAVLMYALTLVPLYYAGYIGRVTNQIFGVDKIIFGASFGTGGMLLGIWLDKKEREKRGKILFPYQKVVFPVSILLILSIIIELLISRF
jgi:hypothetical protein